LNDFRFSWVICFELFVMLPHPREMPSRATSLPHLRICHKKHKTHKSPRASASKNNLFTTEPQSFPSPLPQKRLHTKAAKSDAKIAKKKISHRLARMNTDFRPCPPKLLGHIRPGGDTQHTKLFVFQPLPNVSFFPFFSLLPFHFSRRFLHPSSFILYPSSFILHPLSVNIRVPFRVDPCAIYFLISRHRVRLRIPRR